MMDQRFQRNYRILRGGEFDRAFGRRCSAADDLIVAYGCENGREHPRIGLVVSRKVGGAVVRNRWKRLLREAFRLSRVELPEGIDLVIVPRVGATPSLAGLRTSLPRLATRIAKRLRRERQ